MKKIILLLVVSLISLTAIAEPELKGSPGELTNYLKDIPAIIEVSGFAEVDANADNAIVTLVVKTENKALSGAIKKNQSVRENVRKYLVGKGLKDDDITNSKFSSTPEYGFFGDKPDKYKVNNIVIIKLKSEEELLAVSEAVDGFDEVFLSGTSFEHTEKDKYKKMALEKAIANALAKKSLYENTLGAKLEISSISESTTGRMEQAEMDMARTSKLASYSAPRRDTFGALTYSSTVVIKYKVK